MGAANSPPARSEPRVFERVAEDYRRRPGYPEALVDRLSELTGAGRSVGDRGAGTGALAAPLARRGHRVWAVEPAAAMLEVCRETCQELDVVPVLATAERTQLESRCAGLVLLADAVHWVRPDAAGAEAARLLVPDGVAAVVLAEPLGTPFMRGMQQALGRANSRAQPRSPMRRARQWLALAAGLGVATEESWEQQIPVAPEMLEPLLRSFSYAGPALAPQALARLVEEVRTLATEQGGPVWARRLRLRWLRRARR
jgi:SAM-dependent methyltransferase